MQPVAAPELILANRQRGVCFDLSRILQVLPDVASCCLPCRGENAACLPALGCVEISILSDRAIASVHGRFFGEPAPTDVITFPYGEILLGGGVIAENAILHGHSKEREAVLCVIHGLLHLNGFEDSTPASAAAMHSCQEKILGIVFPGKC